MTYLIYNDNYPILIQRAPYTLFKNLDNFHMDIISCDLRSCHVKLIYGSIL